MKLLALAGDIDALIADIRLRTPLQLLAQREGWTLQWRSFHTCTHADLAAAEVLVVQRGLSRRAWRWMRRMRLRGGAVLYDIDDLLTALPRHVSNHAAVQARQLELALCLNEADLVTVSTERLGQALACSRWQTVPNGAVVPAAAARQSTDNAAGPVSLVFASMESLAASFVFPALRALQQAKPTPLQVVVVGPSATMFEAAGIRVQAAPLMPRADFMHFVRGLTQPLAVIPLEDSLFASCKSAIKWMDYGSVAIPCLCSAVSPYSDVIEHNRNGALVPNDEKSWRVALQAAVQDGPWRQRVGEAAQKAVLATHSLEQTVGAWQRAVAAAQANRGQAPPPAPTWTWRLQELVGIASEGVVQGLQRMNRRRLARRSQRQRGAG